jgi:hypothetical protein
VYDIVFYLAGRINKEVGYEFVSEMRIVRTV